MAGPPILAAFLFVDAIFFAVAAFAFRFIYCRASFKATDVFLLVLWADLVIVIALLVILAITSYRYFSRHRHDAQEVDATLRGDTDCSLLYQGGVLTVTPME